jgi:uncharacterized membrane protein HdeD (DUF308 family)
MMSIFEMPDQTSYFLSGFLGIVGGIIIFFFGKSIWDFQREFGKPIYQFLWGKKYPEDSWWIRKENIFQRIFGIICIIIGTYFLFRAFFY